MQYVHIADSHAEALEAAERARYVGRMAHHLRSAELPLEGGYIRDMPFVGEQTLDQYADNMVVGDVHHVAEKIVENIRRLNFGCMPLERARRTLDRFSAEVLPLVEREVGPVSKIGRGQAKKRESAAA
jgi:alkanesulfonate monooxygenase SsuD/methylene tetrahydromethanopterin reductase-like flavin-dependent oxidoreductase (luciferase family)